MQGSDTSVEGFPATKPEPTLTRRRLLVSAGVAATVFVTPRFGSRTARAGLRHGAELFQLGVASGDPLPDSVVLWTRLARNPLLGGDLPNDPIPVRWELARDEGFRSIVRSGDTLARSEFAHAVHVIPEGLEPARWYWYCTASAPRVTRAPWAGRGRLRVTARPPHGCVSPSPRARTGRRASGRPSAAWRRRTST